MGWFRDLFSRRPPGPVVRLNDSPDTWASGDHAICVVDYWRSIGPPGADYNPPVRGDRRVVEKVMLWGGAQMLIFVGNPGTGYQAVGFRKIRPDALESEETELAKRIRRCRPKAPVRPLVDA